MLCRQDFYWNYCAPAGGLQTPCSTAYMYIVNQTTSPCFAVSPCRLFCVTIVYVIGGSLIKWKFMGVPAGIDLIPQIELWVQVPGLVWDGLKFTKDKALGLCGHSSTHERI
eukprot:Phypoly_transcript_24394.p1 GENE.Phypoly_transcript_24394~~Phypoly_transcript_24394.p1  ORF type:complete len:111 (-),score=9.04 Phypoly_transcript_24394:66-398(-)